MSLVPYDSSDSEFENESSSSSKPKLLKKPARIFLSPLSEFKADDDLETKPIRLDKLNNADLFSYLPPPKSGTSTAYQLIPTVLARAVTRNKSKMLNDNDEDCDLFDEKTDEDTCSKSIFVGPTKRKRVDSAPQVGRLSPKHFTPITNAHVPESMGSFRQTDRVVIKALTDPEQSPKPKVEQVNATCRKKNHISFLVQKVEESEQELKNQWANIKFTRQQTRAKYGF